MPYILITVDVEDWFQVENLRPHFPHSVWDSCELRIEASIHKLLDLFDRYEVSATFFVLGWIAERCPSLVQEIHARGHEIASHGYNHELCSNLSMSDLHDDLYRSKALLENITGQRVYGYRAPSFSISDELLKIIEQCSIINFVFPWGGGGYFRLTPTFLFIRGVKRILRQHNYYALYCHPWEFDPDQPRVNGMRPDLRFRHYINIKKNMAKLKSFISAFSSCNFVSCSDYLNFP